MNRALAALAAAWLTAGAPAQAQERITIAVPLAPSAAPYLAAIENGFFRDAGLDVEIFFASGAVATETLASGETQYSASPFPIVDAALKGADLRVIYVTRSGAPYQLWSFDPAVRRLADVVGRTISVTTRGGAQEVALRMALDAAAISPTGLSLIATPFERERLAAIRDGHERLAILIGGENPGRSGTRLADLSTEAELPIEGLATTGAEIAAHRDRAKRVLHATHRGVTWVGANTDAAIASLRRHMPNESSRDLGRDIAVAIEERNHQGVISRAMTAREIKVRAEMLRVIAPAPENIYDFSLVDELKAERRW